MRIRSKSTWLRWQLCRGVFDSWLEFTYGHCVHESGDKSTSTKCHVSAVFQPFFDWLWLVRTTTSPCPTPTRTARYLSWVVGMFSMIDSESSVQKAEIYLDWKHDWDIGRDWLRSNGETIHRFTYIEQNKAFITTIMSVWFRFRMSSLQYATNMSWKNPALYDDCHEGFRTWWSQMQCTNKLKPTLTCSLSTPSNSSKF